MMKKSTTLFYYLQLRKDAEDSEIDNIDKNNLDAVNIAG